MDGRMWSTESREEATPMEETVQALLETLVSPLLPKRSSYRNPPTESLELSVGKQMHAVVLLYNYFHRKQFPEVEFLDYEAFIKVAVIAKPTLLSFINYSQVGQKTTTEKLVTEAFDICHGLNASANLPSQEGWPVSKVSVLLVDTETKNFLLYNGSVHGVWSLMEKNITGPTKPASVPAGLEKQRAPAKKIFRSTLHSRQAFNLINLDEDALLQVANDAVKEKTGLDSSSLMLLESHCVYSLSKMRSSTQFYLMQCLKEIGGQVKQVPIKDALDSLRSPIVAKVSDSYETTQTVAFFHLLPYEGIISDWLSRENLPSGDGSENGTTTMECKFQSASSLNNRNSNTIMENETHNLLLSSDEILKISNSSSNHATLKNDCWKDDHSYGSENVIIQMDCKVQNLSSAEKIRSHDLMENITLNTIIPSGVVLKSLNCTIDHANVEKDCGEGFSDNPFEDSEKSFLSGSEKVPLDKDSLIVAENQVDVEPCPKELKQCHDVGGISNISEVGARNEIGTTKPAMRAWNIGDMTENILEEVGVDGVDFCIQAGVTRNDLSVVKFDSHVLKIDNFTMVLSSKAHALLQASIKVLHKKRDKLLREHQQLLLKQRHLEDAIALCEKNIQTIVTGGDGASALIIETLIEGCDVAPSKEETIGFHPNLSNTSMTRMNFELPDVSSEVKYAVRDAKRKRLSEAILNLHNPCQELDEICGLNNWMLPIYTVLPSKDGFVATVTIRGLDFDCSSGSDIRSKPQEARESAATCMLNKLRSMASQA